MVSTSELIETAKRGEYTNLWIDIYHSESEVINSFLESKHFDDGFALRVKRFKNLSSIPLGLAPNSTELVELYQHFAFQDFSINIINASDYSSNEESKVQESDYLNLNSQFKVIEQNLRVGCFQSEISTSTEEFVDLFLSLLKDMLIQTINEIQMLGLYESKVIQELLIQSITNLCMYFLEPEEQEYEFYSNFLFKGYLYAKIDNTAYLVYGLPGRRKYLENLVFGNSVSITSQELGCDAVIKHKNGQTLELHFNEGSNIKSDIRPSDTLVLTFSNDFPYGSSERFENLKKNPCNVEVFFKEHSKNRNSENYSQSKREKSRTQMLIELIEKLVSSVSTKITVIDFSNVSDLFDSSILQLVSRCNSMKKLILSNANILNTDFRGIESFPKVQNLDISGLKIALDCFNPLKLFPMLKVLRFSESSEVLWFLSETGSQLLLSKLDIVRIDFSKQTERNFPKLLYLDFLSLKNVDFSASTFVFLSKIPKLKTLKMRDCLFSGLSLYKFSQNGNIIENLDISSEQLDMNLTNEDLLPISSMSKLETLNISNRLISDVFVENLSLNALNLRFLDISFTLISNFSINALKKLEKLQTLNISGCRNINDSGISMLCESEMTLENINLIGSSVTESGYEMLAERFPGIKINLSVNQVTF